MDKGGIGHVEIVLASILFISAMVFILAFVDVENDTDAGEAALALVTSLFQKQSETEVVSYSVLIKKTTGDPPITTPNIINIELPDDIRSEQDIRVEALVEGNRKKIPSQKNPTNPSQIAVDRGSDEITLIYIFLSEEIEAVPSTLSVPAHEPDYYRVLSRSENKILAETKVQALKDSYESDYLALRQSLGLGERINFGIMVTWFNPEIENPQTQAPMQDFIKADRDIPARVDVTAQNVRQELLLQDGQRVFADITIKTW